MSFACCKKPPLSIIQPSLSPLNKLIQYFEIYYLFKLWNIAIIYFSARKQKYRFKSQKIVEIFQFYLSYLNHLGQRWVCIFLFRLPIGKQYKSIIFPLACTVFDMVSAMIQVQRLTKNRTANNIGVYIRTAVAGLMFSL